MAIVTAGVVLAGIVVARFGLVRLRVTGQRYDLMSKPPFSLLARIEAPTLSGSGW